MATFLPTYGVLTYIILKHIAKMLPDFIISSWGLDYLLTNEAQLVVVSCLPNHPYYCILGLLVTEKCASETPHARTSLCVRLIF